MSKGLGDKLVLAISSSALFDLRDSHQIYETQGVEAYRQYQIEHEDEILAPGDAFPLVEKLLALNSTLQQQRVEVILVSRNSADTGLRAFNSIQHYGLGISRAAFVGGRSPDPYLAAFGCHLFLSTHAEDVRSALAAGFGAATICPVVRAEQQATNCALPSTVTPCCFPMSLSGFISRRGSKPSRAMSASRPVNCSVAAHSNPSSLPCTACSKSFPRRSAQFAPRWSPHARLPPMKE